MTKLTGDEICRVLDALIGRTNAIGDAEEDYRIEQNLKNLIDVADWCIGGLLYASEDRYAIAKGMHDIGERAFAALDEIGTWCKQKVEEGG